MITELKPYLFSVKDFHRMGKAGILTEDDRVELLDGEIVEMAPTGIRHVGTVDRLTTIFTSHLGRRVIVRVQSPVQLGRRSEPLPDVTILKARPDFYTTAPSQTTDVLLLIEVADSTARTDRSSKIPLYAAANIAEVWLVDLETNAVEVYRQPSGGGYGDVQRLTPGDHVSPSAFPEVSLAVADILG